jgi:hypothetical protein
MFLNRKTIVNNEKLEKSYELIIRHGVDRRKIHSNAKIKVHWHLPREAEIKTDIPKEREI